MAAFENTMNINMITMFIDDLTVDCPIGKAPYDASYEVLFIPDRIIPDYIEVEKWVNANISLKNLTIEASLKLFKDYLIQTYNPAYVTITCKVIGAAHFDVEVSI